MQGILLLFLKIALFKERCFYSFCRELRSSSERQSRSRCVGTVGRDSFIIVRRLDREAFDTPDQKNRGVFFKPEGVSGCEKMII